MTEEKTQKLIERLKIDAYESNRKYGTIKPVIDLSIAGSLIKLVGIMEKIEKKMGMLKEI